VSAGLAPAGVKLGGSVVWSLVELHHWILHRCPCLTEWEPIRRAIVARLTK
jgi:hypothetical protein